MQLDEQQHMLQCDRAAARAAIGLGVLDRELRYVEVNATLAALSGLAPEKQIGRAFDEVLPTLTAQLAPLLRQVLDTGVPIEDIDLSETPPAAQPRRWLVSAYPVRARSGYTLGVELAVQELARRPTPHELPHELPRLDGAPHDDAITAALRLANERFTIAEALFKGFVYDWYPAEQRVERSAGLRYVVGYAPEEVPPTTDWWRARVHPDDLARLTAAGLGVSTVDAQALADGAPFEYRVRHRDGHYIHVLDQMVIMHDAGGAIARVVGSTVDVSAQKQATERIVRLQSLTAALSEALTPEEVVTVITAQGMAALGAGAGTVRQFSADGQYLVSVRTAGYADVLAQQLRQMPLNATLPVAEVVRTGQPLLFESCASVIAHYPHLEATSRAAGFEAIAVLPLMVQGRAIGSLGFSFSDVRQFSDDDRAFMLALAQQCAQALHRAQLYAAERDARARADESRALLDTLISAAPIGVAFIDAEGRYELANEKVAAMFGWSAAQIVGRTLREVMPSVGEELEAVHRQVRTTGEPIVSREVTGATFATPGVQRSWLVSYYPVRAHAQQVVGTGVIAIEISERKRLEVELRESKEQLEAAIAVGQFGLWWLDVPNARVTYDALFCQMHGLSPLDESHTLTTLLPVIHAEDRPLVAAALEQTLHAHTALNVEYRVVHPDGALRWLHASGGARLDAGRLMTLTGVVQDITARKQAEEVLRQSEARFRYTFEQAPVGVLQVAPDGTIEVVNPAFCQMLGYTAQELLGHTVLEFTHPDDRAADTQTLDRFVQGATDREVREKRYMRKDGAVIWAQITSTGVQDPQQQRTFGVAIVEDITERKRIEVALRESEDRLRLTLASVDIGTWDYNPVTHVLQWDARCKALFGLPPDAMITWEGSFLAGLHPEDRARTEQIVQRALDPASGGEYHIEYRTVGLQDRIERWVAAQGKAFFDATGQPVRFIGTVRDITRRKHDRDELRRLYEAEREARAEAEAAVRARDQFLSLAAHELKTPLTSLLGNAQLLQRRTIKRTVLDEREQRHIQVIAGQALRLNQMIVMLLDTSRTQSGQLALALTTLDLGALVWRIVDELRLTLERHTLELHTPAAPLLVVGDDLRLEQVLQNLVQNAIKYSPEGGTISVTLTRQGDRARVAVTDQGIGIPAEALPHLFERFYRASNTDRHQIAGMGIGLYVVKEIIALHGGTVEVASEGRVGSTFAVLLPLSAGVGDRRQETGDRRQEAE